MEKVFNSEFDDSGLSIKFKREANIILASLDKNSKEYFYKKECFKDVLTVIKAIEFTDPQRGESIDFILDTIYKIWNVGIISPLTLKDDEFENYMDSNGYIHNIRYNYIYIDTNSNMNICNSNAFNLYIRAEYSHKENKQIKCDNKIIYKNNRIYISKGGVITGEYIEKCIIRSNIINKHSFTIQSIPNIPVCIITDKDNSIYVVDHREPKLKALQQFYEVPINKDNDIANRHYNLRKYDKIK